MRDRLIELISKVQYMGGLEEKLADYLLANGIIVPPCPMGTTVYRIVEMGTGVHFKFKQEKGIDHNNKRLGYYQAVEPCEETIKRFIRSVTVTKNNFLDIVDNFGKTVFLTKEEAEKALKEREQV